MYDLQLKITMLLDSLTNTQNKLKEKLTNKGISYNANDTIRRLIQLIPLDTITPINLYSSLNGHTAVNINYSNILFCGGPNSNIQKLYNTNARSYTTKRNYPYSAYQHAGAKWGNNVYYCGGRSSYDKTYAYNIQSNTFTAKSNVPIDVAYHTFVSTNDYLLLSGGYVSSDINKQYIYNTQSNAYSSKRNLTQATDHLSTAHFKDNLVLINGGNDSHNSQLNYVYNIDTNTITSKRNLPQPRGYHKSLGRNADNVLLIGGTSNTSNTTINYQVSSNTFTTKRSSPNTWDDHTMSWLNSNGLYFLISGGDNSNNNNKQYTYDFAKDSYVSS